MRLFLMYLKSRLAVILFFLTLLSVLCVVYGLYGLPWGPAFYTCILIACLGVLALSLGFYKFQRKRKGLEFLKKQVPYFEGFPQPGDPVEQAYQDLTKLLQSYANTGKGNYASGKIPRLPIIPAGATRLKRHWQRRSFCCKRRAWTARRWDAS